MKNPLVEKFGGERRWVNYKLVNKDGKLTKIPFAVSGRKASSTDSSTWSTYEEARKKSSKVGIVFTPDKALLGIDIDHCLQDNEIVHEQKEAIERFIKEADTYTEISPSGTGLHLFLSLQSPIELQAHKCAPYEVYNSGRYFTFTGMHYLIERPVKKITSVEAEKLLILLGYPWKKEEIASSQSSMVPVSMDDETVLRRMFASKNGAAIQSLYDGDISAYADDESSADMALCAHLAFWCGRDASQMERLWLSSGLGVRKKVSGRTDYRKRTIQKAIDRCAQVYSIPLHVKESKERVADKELDLLYTINAKKEIVYTQNTENICRILRHHEDFSGRLRYDVFKNVLELKTPKAWRPIEDNDAVNIQTAISILFPCFGKVGKEMVYDAMIKVAKEDAIDSAADWLRSLSWDKTARLDSWLTTTYGVEDSAYHRAVGSNWLKGLVKRLIEPGCKFDFVLVLEGPQGTKKSSSLYTLGGAWHVETAMSTDSKDFFMQFQGKAIIEFSEGETLSRTEVKRMKAIITMQNDKYRPPYERASQEFPRRCVFAMTTNQEEYLKDETGNRRWLPVATKKPADLEWLAANREQLFAEAYHRVAVLKENIYEFPADETLAAQNERRVRDPNADLVADWYWNKLTEANREEGITVFQVYRDALSSGYSQRVLDKYTEMTIGNTLREVIGLKKERRMKNNVRQWVWMASPELLATRQIDLRTETERLLDGVGL